ncbi:MAG: hypothetical protein U0931_19990 [Vulcanimicrobiota bacterium]
MRQLFLALSLSAAVWSAPQPKVLFAVHCEHGYFVIDPLVYLEKAGPRPVLSAQDGHQLGRQALKFCDRFYRKGSVYTLLCQGRNAGQVHVVDDTSARVLARDMASGGSGAFGAAAAVAGTQPGRAWALAGNFSLQGSHQVSTGDAGPALAATKYRWKGKARAELIVTDLDGDGRAERILTAYEKDRRAQNDADPVGAAFLLQDADGQTLWERHDEEGVQEYSFVEQADLDGDGCDEIVLSRQYYEGSDYEILQRRQGKWRSIFRGGGGGA